MFCLCTLLYHFLLGHLEGDNVRTTAHSHSGDSSKKIKIDPTGNITNLVSLLSNDIRNTANKSNVSNSLLLTPEQLLAARKLIKAVQPAIVNTYLTSKPITIPNNLMPDSGDIKKELPNSTLPIMDSHSTAQLSPTYPKIINHVSIKAELHPISIKAERIDIDCMKPPGVPLDKKLLNRQLYLHRLVSNVTRPTITSNTTAALNLNEINRTQSENELMALVDGDDISADG